MAMGTPNLHGFTVSAPQAFNVADFEEDADNVNEHSEVDLAATANSLQEFGQVENLVVDIKGKKVIGGNGRLRKMKEMGWKTFVGIGVEGGKEQLETLAITLNKTGRMSDFNYPKLVAKLQELQHEDNGKLLALTGFQEHELQPLLSSEMHLISAEAPIMIEPPKKAKGEVDLDSRGMTLQFSVQQKPILDKVIVFIRERENDFSIPPAQCLATSLQEYLRIVEDKEEDG